MGFLCYLSEYLIPVLIFYILADGIFSGTSVYDEFVKGASEGVRTVFRIFRTLVGLMTAVGMLRASGVLDVLTNLLVLPARILHFPEQLIPLALVRLFVGGLATYTFVWNLGDVGIGLMTIFNLAVLYPMSSEALSSLRDYEARLKSK